MGHSYFIQLPPITYSSNVLAFFRSKYAHVKFVVVSDDPTWCLTQSLFAANNVCVVTVKHHPVVDVEILAGCEHMVLTIGTFGW